VPTFLIVYRSSSENCLMINEKMKKLTIAFLKLEMMVLKHKNGGENKRWLS
jgi:hypothetical protein